MGKDILNLSDVVRILSAYVDDYPNAKIYGVQNVSHDGIAGTSIRDIGIDDNNNIAIQFENVF